VLSRPDGGLSRAAPHGTRHLLASGRDSHHAAEDHELWLCRSLDQQEWGAGRNATLPGDETPGEYIQGRPEACGEYIQGRPEACGEYIQGRPEACGEYIQGRPSVLQELIESAPAERARPSAG
jgi:hypothetical protein